MNVLFYSDTHIGLKRQANTTPASAERLAAKLWRTPLELMDGYPDALAVCLGDVFDSWTNSEADIELGHLLALNTAYVLAGNHDLISRTDKLSSYQLLKNLASASDKEKFIDSAYGEPASVTVVAGLAALTFVPHVSSADLFEQSLDMAIKEAEKFTDKWRVLCLHCNYALGESLVKTDTTLNLTQERAYQLLNHFHRILIGHEHVARQDPNTDRIQLVGSTFPTSFNDISDKYAWLYDTDSNTLTSILLWSSAEGSYKGFASELPDTPYAFYDLQDDLPPGAGARLVTKLFNQPDTLAVRISRKDPKLCAAQTSAEEFESLPDLIEKELAKDAELLALFREYRNATETNHQ